MNKHTILLLSFLTNVRLAHWQADSRTNEHKTLGDLYDGLASLVDSFAEVAIGKSGTRTFAPETIVLSPGASHGELIKAGLAVVSGIQAELKPQVDDDLQNITAEIQGEINRAKYLLML